MRSFARAAARGLRSRVLHRGGWSSPHRGGAPRLNDSYKRKPDVDGRRVRALAALPARRRLAVLGVMAELGDGSDAHHRAIREMAADLDIEVLAVAAPAYGAADVASIDEAFERVGDLDADDAVLVKGSRVAQLDILAARLNREVTMATVQGFVTWCHRARRRKVSAGIRASWPGTGADRGVRGGDTPLRRAHRR